MLATRMGFHMCVDKLEKFQLIRLSALGLCRMSRQYFDSDIALESMKLFTWSRRRYEEVEQASGYDIGSPRISCESNTGVDPHPACQSTCILN